MKKAPKKRPKAALTFATVFDGISKSGDFRTMPPLEQMVRTALSVTSHVTMEESADRFVFTLFKRT